MAGPVEAVEAQIRAWRESPAGASHRLEACAGAFAQFAQAVEETLAPLAPQARRKDDAGPRRERQWRWRRKECVLFGTIAAVLSLLALAAGYLAAFSA